MDDDQRDFEREIKGWSNKKLEDRIQELTRQLKRNRVDPPTSRTGPTARKSRDHLGGAGGHGTLRPNRAAAGGRPFPPP